MIKERGCPEVLSLLPHKPKQHVVLPFALLPSASCADILRNRFVKVSESSGSVVNVIYLLCR